MAPLYHNHFPEGINLTKNPFQGNGHDSPEFPLVPSFGLSEFFNSHTGVEEKLAYLLNNVYDDEKVGKIIRIYGMEEMILEKHCPGRTGEQSLFPCKTKEIFIILTVFSLYLLFILKSSNDSITR